jgi:phage gp46-like protein
VADVLLYNTADGGDIQVISGVITLTDGIDTAVFISLFGGNEDDSGSAADKAVQWWANFDEPVESRRLRSETQFLLRSLTLIPANLKRIEDAATRDLSWFVTGKFATFVAVRATMPAPYTVNLEISLEVNGQTYNYTFTSLPPEIPGEPDFTGDGDDADDDSPSGPSRTLFLGPGRQLQTSGGHLLVYP